MAVSENVGFLHLNLASSEDFLLNRARGGIYMYMSCIAQCLIICFIYKWIHTG